MTNETQTAAPVSLDKIENVADEMAAFVEQECEPGLDLLGAWSKRIADALATLRLAQSGAVDEWLPIESAPKDGAWVLLTGGGIGYGWDGGPVPEVVAGQYTNELNGGTTEYHWQFAWYDGGYYGVYESPTHWRPLPAPPALTPPSAKGE